MKNISLSTQKSQYVLYLKCIIGSVKNHICKDSR